MTPAALAETYAKAFQDTRPWSATEFAALLKQPAIHLTGDARSFALIRVVADEAEIITIATDPAHQRQGLAKAVLNAGHTIATQHGAASIFLEVAEDNIPAKALYAALDYVNVGRRKAYYARSNARAVDAIILRCALGSA